MKKNYFASYSKALLMDNIKLILKIITILTQLTKLQYLSLD